MGECAKDVEVKLGVSRDSHVPLQQITAADQLLRLSLHSAPLNTEPPGARRFPDDYSVADLRVITTRALAQGDHFGRALLRRQLVAEEFGERSANGGR